MVELFWGAGVFCGGSGFFVVGASHWVAQFAFDIGNPAGCGGIAVLVFDEGNNLFVCWHESTLLVNKNSKQKYSIMNHL